MQGPAGALGEQQLAGSPPEQERQLISWKRRKGGPGGDAAGSSPRTAPEEAECRGPGSHIAVSPSVSPSLSFSLKVNK